MPAKILSSYCKWTNDDDDDDDDLTMTIIQNNKQFQKKKSSPKPPPTTNIKTTNGGEGGKNKIGWIDHDEVCMFVPGILRVSAGDDILPFSR